MKPSNMTQLIFILAVFWIKKKKKQSYMTICMLCDGMTVTKMGKQITNHLQRETLKAKD